MTLLSGFLPVIVRLKFLSLVVTIILLARFAIFRDPRLWTVPSRPERLFLPFSNPACRAVQRFTESLSR